MRRRLLQAGVLAALAAWSAAARATAQAQAAPPGPTGRPALLAAALADVPLVRLPFDITAEPESRLVFATLRSTVPLQRVTLMNPAGVAVWRLAAAELRLQPRQTLQQPARGDGYFLPPVPGASSGRWQLLIEREPTARGAGRLETAYSVFPRFELDILPALRQGAAGESLLLTVRPREHGAPVAGLPGIVVQVFDGQDRQVARLQAVEQARSREGLVISTEPGSYLATLSLPAAGRYRLEAAHAFGGPPAATRTAVAHWQVQAAAGALALQGLRLQRSARGCIENLLLDFDVQVPSAGLYTCQLTLRGGNPAWPRASATAELQAGAGRLTVAVSAAKLAALGTPWERLDHAVLMQVGGSELRFMAALSDIGLSAYGANLSGLCP